MREIFMQNGERLYLSLKDAYTVGSRRVSEGHIPLFIDWLRRALSDGLGRRRLDPLEYED